jgi:hypothetical protein
MKKVVIISLAMLLIASSHSTGRACRRIGEVSHLQMVNSAVLIVRATALKYEKTPKPDYWTSGQPDSIIEFHVEEVLKGKAVPEKLILNGYLSDQDDFNDHPVPYSFVRMGGRHGSCFANTYKQGAQFLLFLGKKPEGTEGTEYTPDIDALAPVNEQLHSADDAWLVWVRNFLKSLEKKPEPPKLDKGSAQIFTRVPSLISGANLNAWLVSPGF